MKGQKILLAGTILVLGILACTFGQKPPPPAVPELALPTQVGFALTDFPLPTAGPPPSSDILTPEDLEYLGAFRLPDANGGSNWEYSGQGLTFFPGGDPGGSDDGFPGSLFGFGHDHHMQVSEISIPEPIISENLSRSARMAV